MNEVIQNKSPREGRLALIEEKRASSCTVDPIVLCPVCQRGDVWQEAECQNRRKRMTTEQTQEQQKTRLSEVRSDVLLDHRFKKCAVCRKQIDLDDKSTFKTGLHGGLHFYVCSTKCLRDYYK